MTEELERRWRAGEAPFNGRTVTVASEDLTPIPALLRALLAVVTLLERRWPEAQLMSLQDWHEHDGFITAGSETSWQSLFSLLTSDHSLLTAAHPDWVVRLAFFPRSYDFYLRLYVPTDDDNDYPERRGEFDVTCSPDTASLLVQAATAASGVSLAEEEARPFFDGRYGE